MLFARTRIPVASSRPLSARSAVPFTPACVPAPRPSPCQLQRSVRCLVAEQTPAAAAAGVALKDAELQPIMHQGELQLHKMADVAGVYAVFDKEGQLQYIGLSRKVSSRQNPEFQADELAAAPADMDIVWIHAHMCNPLTATAITDRCQHCQPHARAARSDVSGEVHGRG